MDLQELKRRALTEPDPRVQAQYAEQLVKAAESESAARPISKRSSFYGDGYRAGLNGEEAAPPGDYRGTTVNAQDYADGYADGEYKRKTGQDRPVKRIGVRPQDRKAARPALAKAGPKRYPTTKKPGDPTYSAEWSGVTGAPLCSKGCKCPKCGTALHAEEGSHYCPSCDDYVRPSGPYHEAVGKAARPAMNKVASLSLGVPYDTIADAEEFRAMQAPDKYDILHNIEEDKFYAVRPSYSRRMLQNPRRWEYANTRRPGTKAARPTTRKAARRLTRR